MMKILKTLQNVGFVIILFFKGDIKVRDHCHISGKYYVAAHEL